MRHLLLLCCAGCFVTPQAYEDQREALTALAFADCDGDGLASQEKVGFIGDAPPDCDEEGGEWLSGDDVRWDCDDGDPTSEERTAQLCSHELGGHTAFFDDRLLAVTTDLLTRTVAQQRCLAWGAELARLDDQELLDWADHNALHGWTAARHDGERWNWAPDAPVDDGLLCPAEGSQGSQTTTGLVPANRCLEPPSASADDQQEANGFFCQRPESDDR